jgi:hypothetical protein
MFVDIFNITMLMIWYIEPPFHGMLILPPMVYRTPYPWYFEYPTRGISNPISMVYRTPYAWCIELMVCCPSIYGIYIPLSMVYWIPYPWYFDPLPMVYWTPYSWYFEPPIHDISNYGILSPYLLTIETPVYLMIRNEGVQNTTGVQLTIQRQFSKRVLSISWMKFDPYIMGFKVSYDTGVKISPKMMECHW